MTESVAFSLVPKQAKVKKQPLSQKQVSLIEKLNCLLLDFSDKVEGFEDDDHTEQILDLVLASHGWEWEEFHEEFHEEFLS